MRFNAVGNGHRIYFLSTTETRNYNDMTDGKNFFVQPVKKNLRRYENIRKMATGEGDDNTTGFLLDYNHFKI